MHAASHTRLKSRRFFSRLLPRPKLHPPGSRWLFSRLLLCFNARSPELKLIFLSPPMLKPSPAGGTAVSSLLSDEPNDNRLRSYWLPSTDGHPRHISADHSSPAAVKPSIRLPHSEIMDSHLSSLTSYKRFDGWWSSRGNCQAIFHAHILFRTAGLFWNSKEKCFSVLLPKKMYRFY